MMFAAKAKPIYLDHNATTPLLPEVAEAIRACYAEPYLNPASQHEYGRRARRVLEDARERIGELLGANLSRMDADQLIFTSGGTEANNLAIRGLTDDSGLRVRDSHNHQRDHLIISAVEHPSVSVLADELAKCGWAVDTLGVDSNGVMCSDQLAGLLCPDTRLVAAMLGQNETGVIQPVSQLSAICLAHGVPMHTDAAQVAGKLPVDFRALGATTMTVAAHKFHGPLGIGALVVRHGTQLRPHLFGGAQQAGIRPGTEPVALAVGMCRALELWHAQRAERAARMRHLRDRLASGRDRWSRCRTVAPHFARGICGS
jgi:cysteine desulfurase